MGEIRPERDDEGRGDDARPGRDPPDDLENMLRTPMPVLPDQEGIIGSMTALHAAWYRAWQSAGIPEERAYGLLRVMVREGCRHLSWGCSGPEVPVPGLRPWRSPMAKQPLPEPTVPWWLLAAYRAWDLITWPLQAQQMKRAGFRHTGWRTWETGPEDPFTDPGCYRSVIGIMMHGPSCQCGVPGG